MLVPRSLDSMKIVIAIGVIICALACAWQLFLLARVSFSCGKKPLGTPAIPFFPSYFGISLFELNLRKKCTLIIKGLLGSLELVHDLGFLAAFVLGRSFVEGAIVGPLLKIRMGGSGRQACWRFFHASSWTTGEPWASAVKLYISRSDEVGLGFLVQGVRSICFETIYNLLTCLRSLEFSII